MSPEPARDAVPTVPDVVQRLLDRVDALEAEVAGLRAGRAAPVAAGDPVTARPVGRRAALASLAGAAALGTAALAPARPAAAGDGDALVLGSTANAATGPTGLAVGGTTAPYGIAVTDNGVGSIEGRPAVVGYARNVAFQRGVAGIASGSLARGVDAQGRDGAYGITTSSDRGTALFATSQSDAPTVDVRSGSAVSSAIAVTGGSIGVDIWGPETAHMVLWPTSTTPSSAQATRLPGAILSSGYRGGSSGPGHATLWACVTDGRTAADFRVLAGPGSAGALHVLRAPARVYDSRPGTLPTTGPKTQLGAGEVRTVDLKGNASGVPAGATAAVLSVLLVNAASGAGNVTVWAGGVSRPQANTMVWGGTAGRHSTTALASLDAAARVQVSASIPTHLVLDVVAYYR